MAAYFVARFGSLATWVAWIAIVLALYIGYLRLRPGRGSAMSAEEIEQLVGSGTPVMLHLYSNYCLGSMAAKPMLDSMQKELGRHVRFVRLDVASKSGKTIGSSVGLDMVPTFIGYDGQGNERWRYQQLPSKGELWRRVAALA